MTPTRPITLETIQSIKPYKGGDSTLDTERVIKLSSNESPFGCSPAAKAAGLRAMEHPELYPDGGHLELRQAISKTYGLPVDQIICGAGSDEVISLFIKGFCPTDSEIIHTTHAFAMYHIYALGGGVHPVAVAEKAFRADVSSILDAINEKTSAVFLANPNNPTGTWLDRDEIAYLIDRLPPHILLVLDGAYAEYLETEDRYDPGYQYVTSHPNVAVTGTCSKVHGLGGLRVGWGAASVDIVTTLNKIRGPFNVSAVGLAAAAAGISDTSWWRQQVVTSNQTKDEFCQFLTEHQLRYIPSGGNFVTVLLADADQAQNLDERFRSDGIITRRIAGYGIPEGLRISMGTSEDMKLVCEVLESWHQG